MKIVFLEELIGKPRETLNNLLDFIGTSERYAYETLPLSNEGGFVMADLEGYQLARLRLKEIESSWNKDIKNLKKIEKTKSEIEKRYEEAPKLYGVKMKAEQRRRIETYYNNSVRQLENWLKKDLTSIWF